MSIITTTTNNVSPIYSPEIAEILATLTTIGEEYNRNKTASAALAFERKHNMDRLAIQIADLHNLDHETIMTAVRTIADAKGHTLKTFARALIKTVDKICEGRAVLRRVSR